MTANTGRNNAGEEILVFLVVGIGGIALLNKMTPRSLAISEHGFAPTDCSTLPGRACLILVRWDQLVLPT